MIRHFGFYSFLQMKLGFVPMSQAHMSPVFGRLGRVVRFVQSKSAVGKYCVKDGISGMRGAAHQRDLRKRLEDAR
jgi:hypothetical protein